MLRLPAMEVRPEGGDRPTDVFEETLISPTSTAPYPAGLKKNFSLPRGVILSFRGRKEFEPAKNGRLFRFGRPKPSHWEKLLCSSRGDEILLFLLFLKQNKFSIEFLRIWRWDFPLCEGNFPARGDDRFFKWRNLDLLGGKMVLGTFFRLRERDRKQYKAI